MTIFLSEEDVAKLTGRKQKPAQVDWLRLNGIQFYINAEGRAIVPKSAIEGSKEKTAMDKPWEPSVLNQ